MNTEADMRIDANMAVLTHKCKRLASQFDGAALQLGVKDISAPRRHFDARKPNVRQLIVTRLRRRRHLDAGSTVRSRVMIDYEKNVKRRTVLNQRCEAVRDAKQALPRYSDFSKRRPLHAKLDGKAYDTVYFNDLPLEAGDQPAGDRHNMT